MVAGTIEIPIIYFILHDLDQRFAHGLLRATLFQALFK